MDRFIAIFNSVLGGDLQSLKSNMDRFIVHYRSALQRQPQSLKSNMDRFIDDTCVASVQPVLTFKIQYG